MPTPYTEELPVAITAFRSSDDGVISVQIDQEVTDVETEDTRIRVYLNDSTLYRGDTEEDSALDQDEARDVARHLSMAWQGADLPSWEQQNLRVAVEKTIKFLRGERS